MMEPTTTGAKILRVVLALLVIAGLIGAVVVTVWLVKGIYDRSVVTKAVSQGNARVEHDMGVANTTAAIEKAVDENRIVDQAKELSDAENGQDVAVSGQDSAAERINRGVAARQRRGCVILRQQGRDTSRIAACR